MATVVLGYKQEKKVKYDPSPQIRSAGHAVIGVRERENADFSIRQDVHMDKVSTPEFLKKFRKGHVNEPGKK